MATRRYRKSSSTSLAAAPELVLKRFRLDESKWSALEIIVEINLAKGDAFNRYAPKLKQVVAHLKKARDHVEKAAAITEPYTGAANAILDAIDQAIAVNHGEMELHASRRPIGGGGGKNPDIHRHNAIEKVAEQLLSRDPMPGFRIQSVSVDEAPKVAGEFVAACAYVRGYDRHGSWNSIKSRYQQHARRILCDGKSRRSLQ